MARPLLDAAAPTKRLIADKAYDADSLRHRLRQRRAHAVIPSSAARTVPYPLDREAYKSCNVVERPFDRFENWRHLANRYDRLAQSYLAALP